MRRDSMTGVLFELSLTTLDSLPLFITHVFSLLISVVCQQFVQWFLTISVS